MTEEKTPKKLTARERKNVQRNADAVKREIERTARRKELMTEMAAIKFSPDQYQFLPGYQLTMVYQQNPAYVEITRKLDELKAESEIAAVQGSISEAQDRLDRYLEMLAERS